MHVFLDARNITDTPAGVARYALSLIPRMIEQRPGWQWSVLRHSSNREPIEGASEVFVDQQIDGLANWLRGGRTYRRAFGEVGTPDVVHSLFHLLPRDVPADSKVVVTAHDFIWIDHPEISQSNRLGAFTIRQFASRAIPDALRRADRVIAVSEATAERATEWVDRGHIEVVPHGVDPRFFDTPPPADAQVASWLTNGGRYIVAVGNSKYYKNLQTLVRAFAQLPATASQKQPSPLPSRSAGGVPSEARRGGHRHPTTTSSKQPNPSPPHRGGVPRQRRGRVGDPQQPTPLRLVLVGSCDGLRDVAERLGVGDRVVTAGFLDDDALRRVVGHASAFVFPSLVEGFGLPPLEAMALGVPTIVSDLEPMRSVVGDAALTFEPTDVGALSELLRLVLGDNELSGRLRELGRQRAARFDWEETARRTVGLYERVSSG